MKKTQMTSVILAMSLLAVPWLVDSTSSAGVYDPWYDLDDDGKIDIFDVVRVAGAYGSSGEPYAAKAAIAYDTGWIDINDLAGQYFDITHTLDSMDVMVDLQGKTRLEGGVHQHHLGGTGFHPGWSKIYGGSDDDYSNAVIRTVDGGYAVAGTTYLSSPWYTDAVLVKTDAAGNIQWNRTYGGAGDDYAQAVVQTSDGGYALAGYTDSSGSGGYDVWLIKTDGNGALEWSRMHGGSGWDLAHSVVQTTDGGYALACSTESVGAGGYDMWLVKTYANGTFQWGITYGGAGNDFAVSLVQTVDNGYALAGYTTSFGAGNEDFWFVKTNAAGGKEWDRTYGGADTERARAVIQTEDGGYALVGFTDSFGAGLYDAWLVKTGADGVMQWDRTYGGYSVELARAVVQTSDGGYALACDTSSFGAGSTDAWLVKTDPSGIQQWSRTYGEPTTESVSSLVPTSDGGYALAGYIWGFGSGDTDFWLVKTEAELGLMWIDSTASSIRLYRGVTDLDWNFVRVRIWKLHETP